MRYLVATLALFVCAAFAVGQQPMRPPVTGTAISASSESVVRVRPDQATLSIAVVTEAPTAQEAGAKNAQETERLQAALKNFLSNRGELKTSGYSVYPQYQTGNRSNNKISHYVARNSLEVTINDLTIVGDVIDTATKAGANNIGALQFSVKDEEAAKTNALVQATTLAREKAEAMAGALGLSVQRVISVTDAESPQFRPVMMEASFAMRADAAAPSTPVDPGLLEIRSRVTVVIEAK